MISKPLKNNDTVTMTVHDLELFAYHVSVLHRDSGKFTLCNSQGRVEIEIGPNPYSAAEGKVWDSVTMNGHSVGNRCGGHIAYARFVAGDSSWWRASVYRDDV